VEVIIPLLTGFVAVWGEPGDPLVAVIDLCAIPVLVYIFVLPAIFLLRVWNTYQDVAFILILGDGNVVGVVFTVSLGN
jgi:hypothetical protein